MYTVLGKLPNNKFQKSNLQYLLDSIITL